MIGFVLAGGHLVGGILQARYSDDWDDGILSSINDADTIRSSMIASAVSHVLHIIAHIY